MRMLRGASQWLIILAFLILWPARGNAADFDISPVRLFFDPGQKSNLIKLKNNSEQELPFQLSIFAWSQDAEGKDRYTATSDLIVFPKLFALGKNEERIIRVGVRVPVGETEKTYRIYFEQMPNPQSKPDEKTNIVTLMRIGVPVFIEPAKADPRGKVESIKMSEGKLFVLLRNSGNVHFLVKKIQARGADREEKQVFSKESGAKYVLSGASAEIVLPIAEEECRGISHIKLAISTDRFTLNERFDVLPEMCSP